MGEEIRNQAFEDYKKGIKYKDIAEKYGVSLSAVKSWAARYWKKEGCNQSEKKLQPKKKRLQPEPKGRSRRTGMQLAMAGQGRLGIRTH